MVSASFCWYGLYAALSCTSVDVMLIKLIPWKRFAQPYGSNSIKLLELAEVIWPWVSLLSSVMLVFWPVSSHLFQFLLERGHWQSSTLPGFRYFYSS